MQASTADQGFQEFYRLEFSRVVASVRFLAGAAAEDVAQEAFIVARQRWDEIASFEIPFAWVRRVAIRIAGRLGERERMRLDLEARITLSHSADLTSKDLDVVAALAELPDRNAAAVWLHHFDDRPVIEVAEQLECSVAAAKVLLLRSRRRLADRLGGVSGRWVSEQRWTPDAIVSHLQHISAGEHVGVVLEEDLEGRGGRWELAISPGSYLLSRDDGLILDHGSCTIEGSRVAFAPTLAEGHVLFRSSGDGDRLRLEMIENTTPPTRGVPDQVWMSLFVSSGAFCYSGKSEDSV